MSDTLPYAAECWCSTLSSLYVWCLIDQKVLSFGDSKGQSSWWLKLYFKLRKQKFIWKNLFETGVFRNHHVFKLYYRNFVPHYVLKSLAYVAAILIFYSVFPVASWKQTVLSEKHRFIFTLPSFLSIFSSFSYLYKQESIDVIFDNKAYRTKYRVRIKFTLWYRQSAWWWS